MEKADLSSDATWAHGLTRVQQPGPVTVGGQSGRLEGVPWVCREGGVLFA